MQTVATSPTTPRKAGNVHDREYRSFLESFAKRFNDNLGGDWLFTTDASGLWEAYLASFPESQRQFHNCCACRHFVERFGGLVTIAEDGSSASAVWLFTDDVPADYRAGFRAMEKLVRKAKVTGVFLSSDAELGQSLTGNFRHMSVANPAPYKRGLLTAGQAAAEKREDHHNVMRALAEFTAPMVNQALELLKSEALYRSEKVAGPAQWLADLHAAIEKAPGRKSNVAWRAVAAAPAGFCHPRSSMVGTLLEDIAAGKDFAEVSRAFKAKMHPLLYQRPQAAPSAGNIAQAEKLVAELGIAESLKRRFARLDEIETIWKPAEAAKPSGGESVFGHLKAKDKPGPSQMNVTRQSITWDKFRRVVLDGAVSLEVWPPHQGNFSALLTAENADAPPILQWDIAERRNPVSSYVYNGGSLASQWGLHSGGWVRATAVALQPPQWFGAALEHHGEGALFILDGCRDSRTGQGNALFPETLKSELRQVRSTIEAYSRGATIGGLESASACGIALSKNSCGVVVRATIASGTSYEYLIDRWD